MTTDSVIRHEYLEWLVLQVGNEKINDIHQLCAHMHNYEFVWFVANDDNRIQDGLDLRVEFLYEKYDPTMLHVLRMKHCSVLEVLVALSRRVEFQMNGNSYDWAWILLEHLGLDKYRGRLSQKHKEEIDDILETLVWRNYEANGMGSFFPLAWPEFDMRTAEIWKQMHAWINEQHPM